MNNYTVEVLEDSPAELGVNSPEECPSVLWQVRASTPDDAIQLAFALDGGWGSERLKKEDATQMLDLAKAYCRIVDTVTVPTPS